MADCTIDNLDLETLQSELESLRAANARLESEAEGLANEVLTCYEQINLVFDVTAEMAGMNDSNDVLRLLLRKLRFVYAADAVYSLNESTGHVIQVNSADKLCESMHAGEITLPVETDKAQNRLKASTGVFFSSDNNDTLEQQGLGNSIWGPLMCGGKMLAAIGVIRRAKPFEAGDMNLLDSTMTFASHILSNLYLLEQLRKASLESVRALVNAIDQKDPYTSGHSERVGMLSRCIGHYMGLSGQELQDLEWGGLLHDVGKIGIPEYVLNKPGKLTEEEFKVIQDHPARGHAVLSAVESLSGVLDIVLLHHETPDGTGYPRGLKGDEIPLLAQIVHVADTFDALTSTRSYRKAFSFDRAIEIMREDSGDKLDGNIVELFVKAWERVPIDFAEEYTHWFGLQKEQVQ